MRATTEQYLEKFFPGMGLRPFYLTVLSAFLLVIYYYEGSVAPRWFLAQGIQITGIDNVNFHRHLWSHLSAVVLLLIIPLFIVSIAEGWRPNNLGFSVRNAKKEIMFVELLWLLMIPVICYVASTPAFQKIYPRLRAVDNNMQLFIYFELAYLIKWIAWEFFFRGFMLFSFAKDMGNKAVLISTLPFVIMHIGKPEAEILGSIIAGFVLCYIALRSKSIWPGVLLHWQIAMTMNFFASSWWR